MSNLANAQSLFFSALQAHERSDLKTAEHLYREALALAPGRSSIIKNLAAVLLESAKFDEVRALCSGHLRSHPDDAVVWTQLGNNFLGEGQFAQALESFTTALAQTPDNTEILINAAYALECLGRPLDALTFLNNAIQIAPDNAAAIGNRGNVLAKLNHFQEALLDFQHAQRIAPESPMSYWNESVCRLFSGDLEDGWRLYDWGWKARQRGERPPGATQPRWNGIDYVNRLLVWGEQGIGDQILFSSMLDELNGRAKHIIVAVDSRLMEILRRTFPGFDFIDIKTLNNPLDADQQIAIGDLGRFFRKDWGDFTKAQKKYLIPDASRVQMLRKRLSNGQDMVCGFSWSSTNPRIGLFKSLAEADLSPLAGVKSTRWVDLQYGDTLQDRGRFLDQFGLNVTHLADIDNFNDIDGLAALIGACDIVVSVSNTTAHLAGALGVPTVVLLPEAVGRLWYWHHGVTSSPWYPSCRLIRQTAPGDWTSVIDSACKLITEQALIR